MVLRSHNIQFLSVSSFKSSTGVDAFEVNGILDVFEKSLGFGQYSATDTSARFARWAGPSSGSIQIDDPNGSASSWTIRRDGRYTWISKEVGVPDIPDGCHIRITRSFGGRLSLKTL
jgi:hypothetical protein